MSREGKGRGGEGRWGWGVREEDSMSKQSHLKPHREQHEVNIFEGTCLCVCVCVCEAIRGEEGEEVLTITMINLKESKLKAV